MSKITIVLATYNGELYLKEQLDSILNQSFKDYSLLIGDDGSTDNTLNILKEYQKRYSHITVLKNRERLGVVYNFEKLINQVSTDYIALCDQDDIWDIDKLEKSIEYLENNNQEKPLMFHCDLRGISGDNKKLYNSFFEMRGYAFFVDRAVDVMLGRCGVMGNTIVFNQALKKKILPFPKDLMVHDYWIALVNEFFGRRVTYNKPLLSYRLHANNTSKSFRKSIKSKLDRKKIPLPFRDIKRELVLEEFLNRFEIDKKDKKIVDDFLEYLYFKKNYLSLVLLVFKYNFFRIGFKYKIKLLGAMLWKK